MSDEVKFFLYGIARRHLNICDPFFSHYSSVICDALIHPSCRQIRLTREKREQFLNLLVNLHESPELEAEAFRVSLARLNAEKGFDPYTGPRVKWLIQKDPDAHLKLRDAFAVIAIAWQLHVYGDRLVLTGAEYNTAIARHRLPLN